MLLQSSLLFSTHTSGSAFTLSTSALVEAGSSKLMFAENHPKFKSVQ